MGIPVKDDIVEVVIEDMSSEGDGIGKVGGSATKPGFTLFIKDTVIGDRALVKVMKTKKTYGYARLMELIEPSKDRVEPACMVARSCGGCQLQCLSYEKQLQFKHDKVAAHMKRIGGFSDEVTILPTIGGDHILRYRNKALIPFGVKKDKETGKETPVAGFFAGRSHFIVEVSDCLLTPEENEKVLKTVLGWMEAFDVKPYKEAAMGNPARGVVRHLLIRKAYATGQLMVCLVINKSKLSKTVCDGLVNKLVKLDVGITSISLNVNMEETNVIMGQKVINLHGPGYITDYIGEVSFQISPLSFYQVNPEQTKKLYEVALSYAGLTGQEVVWDLYCGIGTISLFLAKAAKAVYGVEIVPEAIEDARENAKRNQIENAEFFVGRAEEVLPKLYHDDPERYQADVIVVDPPRKGCEPELLDTVLAMQPKRFVYVSCDSATMARDLRYLMDRSDGAYTIEKVQPVDQFEMTVHVETVVALHRTNS